MLEDVTNNSELEWKVNDLFQVNPISVDIVEHFIESHPFCYMQFDVK
jgi:hypothetical protein